MNKEQLIEVIEEKINEIKEVKQQTKGIDKNLTQLLKNQISDFRCIIYEVKKLNEESVSGDDSCQGCKFRKRILLKPCDDCKRLNNDYYRQE